MKQRHAGCITCTADGEGLLTAAILPYDFVCLCVDKVEIFIVCVLIWLVNAVREMDCSCEVDAIVLPLGRLVTQVSRTIRCSWPKTKLCLEHGKIIFNSPFA